MTKSFAFRLTLAVALTIVCATSVVLLIAGWRLGDRHLRKMDWWVTDESRQIAGMIQETRPGLSAAEVIEYVVSKTANIGDHTLYFIQIGKADGSVLYRSANLGTAFLSPNPGNGSHWTSNLPSISNMRITEAPAGEWRVRVGLPMDGRDVILDSFTSLSLLIMGVTIILSLPIGYFLSRFMLAPLNAIEESARRIRANNLQERVYVPENNRELASLATEFNRAFDDLEIAFGQIRRFTADASHELKTPLTLIRLNAEKLRKQHENGCPHATVCEPLMSSLQEEIDSMRRIIDSLLFIARADAGALSIEREPRDMQACIEDFAEDGRTLAEDKGLCFEVGENAPGTPAFELKSVRQLLLNLTSNAVAVSPIGGKITLDSAPAGDGRWRLSITDEGPGLPADVIESIFTRFWRLRPSSTPPFKASGHGLGLAICKSIATLHGGTIRAENRADRTGLRIIFEW